MIYLAELEKTFPDLSSHLNPTKNSMALLTSRHSDLPQAFLDLYQHYNGETNAGPGIFAGFSWMSAEDIINTQTILQKTSSRTKYSTPKNQITECEFSEKWIPFAHDHAGNYLALDLIPGSAGKHGQIIALDRATDEIIVIKESLTEFFLFILSTIKNKQLTLNKEEDAVYFSWHSGHLFNDPVDIVATPTSQPKEFHLAGYWAEHFNQTKTKGKISLDELNKIKSVRITNHNNINEWISLNILEECQNLTELICHCNEIESFAPLAKCQRLRKFYVKSNNFNQQALALLGRNSSIVDLGLINTNLESLTPLAKSNIQTLALINTQLDDASSISQLSSISELRIEGLLSEDFNWIGHLKKLKNLSLKKISIHNWSFLTELNTLEELTINSSIQSTDDLIIAKLANLKRTDWPFSNLALLNGNQKLESIGIDISKVNDFQDLQNTQITAVTLVNGESKTHAREAIDKIQQFRKLSSFAWVN